MIDSPKQTKKFWCNLFAAAALASYRGWGEMNSKMSEVASDCFAMGEAMWKQSKKRKVK